MSRNDTRYKQAQQDDVEILNLNYSGDLEKEEQHRKLFEALLEVKTPSGEPTVTAAGREVLRAFYTQHMQADFRRAELDERVEGEDASVSDYDQLSGEIEVLRGEVAQVVERVAEIKASMENRWQDYKETVSFRLTGIERSVDRFSDTVQTLVQTQENRLAKVEQEFSGLRAETSSGLNTIIAKLDEQRKEFETKIDKSRDRTIAMLGIFVAAATLVLSVAIPLLVANLTS